MAKEGAESPSYTIASGDTLSSIARRHGTTVAELARTNNIKDPNRVRAGVQLSIPGARAATPVQAPTPASPRAHVQTRPEWLDALGNDVREWEGFRGKAYADPVKGWEVPTIGYGTTRYNDGRRVSRGDTIDEARARAKMERHLDRAYKDARGFLPDFDERPEPVRRALVDMTYNMGRHGVSKFEKALGSLREGDYGRAADHMADSKWFKQTGRRARHHVDAVRGLAAPKVEAPPRKLIQ